MFVIVDPVNPQNNTARNSHRTPEILTKFQEAFVHLKSLIMGEYLRLTRLRATQEQQAQRKASPEVVALVKDDSVKPATQSNVDAVSAGGSSSASD